MKKTEKLKPHKSTYQLALVEICHRIGIGEVAEAIDAYCSESGVDPEVIFARLLPTIDQRFGGRAAVDGSAPVEFEVARWMIDCGIDCGRVMDYVREIDEQLPNAAQPVQRGRTETED